MTRMSPLLNNLKLLVDDSRLITVQNARIFYSSVCSFHHHLFLVKCDFSSTSLMLVAASPAIDHMPHGHRNLRNFLSGCLGIKHFLGYRGSSFVNASTRQPVDFFFLACSLVVSGSPNSYSGR